MNPDRWLLAQSGKTYKRKLDSKGCFQLGNQTYLDDVATVELVWIISNVRSLGHCGQHDEVDAKTPGAEKAVKINF